LEAPVEELQITTQDGYALGATLYPAEGRERGVILLAGATGVPQPFYTRFARFLSARGHTVLTFDYRGIGRSLRGPLRGFKADFRIWAEQDLAAMVDWGLARGPLVVIGHSFGGHAFGLLPRVNETLGLYVFGSGSGWHGHMPRDEQVKVLALWHGLAPVATRAFGYLPMSALGLGENLPLGVYRQWKRWCSFPRYFLEDPEVDFAARFARVRVPVVSANTTDDRWATTASARALFSGLTGTTPRFETLDPRVFGIGPVGHMGYFRSQAAPLWEAPLAFAEERFAAQKLRSEPQTG
jgi:predicted alpha/beta hydrolase